MRSVRSRLHIVYFWKDSSESLFSGSTYSHLLMAVILTVRSNIVTSPKTGEEGGGGGFLVLKCATQGHPAQIRTYTNVCKQPHSLKW